MTNNSDKTLQIYTYYHGSNGVVVDKMDIMEVIWG